MWHQVDMYTTERALLDACVEAVRALDPDLLIGFDVQKARSPPFSKFLSSSAHRSMECFMSPSSVHWLGLSRAAQAPGTLTVR